MANEGVFTISDFAKLSRTTRDTLLYYDRIGLLKPEQRGENNYRYYSNSMLEVVNVIRTLQKLGMSLEEIKYLKDRRTPELADEVFTRQIEKIDDKIGEWVRARKLLLTLQKSIRDAAVIDEKAVTIRFLPAQAIALGDTNDYRGGRNAYDALLSFYISMRKKYSDMDLNYPVWAVFSEERIKNRDWVWPDRYYFYNPEGPDRRPASLYATGYARGGYGQSDGLYRKILAYIDENGFEICGDAYEEYPLNEVCIAKDDNYLIRVMITVREKAE